MRFLPFLFYAGIWRRRGASLALLASISLFVLWAIGQVVRDHFRLTAFLFYIPSPLLTLLLLCTAAICLVGRHRGQAGLLLALALTPLYFVLFIENHWRQPATEMTDAVTQPIRVVHWNVMRARLGVAGITRALAKEEPDLAVLSEAPARQKLDGIAANLGAGYTCRHMNAMAVICRGTLRKVTSLSDTPSLKVMAIEWEYSGRNLLVFAVDIGSSLRNPRNRHLRRLMNMVERHQPDLVVGDFNAPRRSLALSRLPAGYSHAYDEAGAGWSYSWPVPCPVFAIDQCLTGYRIMPTRHKLTSTLSSDHRMQTVDLVVLERPTASLPQEVYVWQRRWNEAVKTAIREHAHSFSKVVALGAEVSFGPKGPEIVRVRTDRELLGSLEVPVGLAVRIGNYPGPFAADNPLTLRIASLCRELVADAASAGLGVAELQIDFDCATSKLAGYAVWLRTLRSAVAPVPLVFTALPTWLGSGSFAELAAAADGFVLQVHSLENPRTAGAEISLCQPADAFEAVRRAALAGKPFRVALPTYGYVVALDQAGKVVDVSAEDASAARPGIITREIRADAASLARLLDILTTRPPPNLEGVIWYRMPTSDDRLNWRWKTLETLLRGEYPSPDLKVLAHRTEPRLWQLDLTNSGTADASLDVGVSAAWSGAQCLAGDAFPGFALAASSNRVDIRRSRKGEFPSVVMPDECRPVAWLRLDAETEVSADVTPVEP